MKYSILLCLVFHFVLPAQAAMAIKKMPSTESNISQKKIQKKSKALQKQRKKQRKKNVKALLTTALFALIVLIVMSCLSLLTGPLGFLLFVTYQYIYWSLLGVIVKRLRNKEKRHRKKVGRSGLLIALVFLIMFLAFIVLFTIVSISIRDFDAMLIANLFLSFFFVGIFIRRIIKRLKGENKRKFSL